MLNFDRQITILRRCTQKRSCLHNGRTIPTWPWKFVTDAAHLLHTFQLHPSYSISI